MMSYDEIIGSRSWLDFGFGMERDESLLIETGPTILPKYKIRDKFNLAVVAWLAYLRTETTILDDMSLFSIKTMSKRPVR